MSDRFIPLSELPISLWNPSRLVDGVSTGCLILPSMLEAAYRHILEKHDLIGLASDLPKRKSGEIGDDGQEGAERHLALRFSGSCGRIQLYAIDPHNTFQTSFDALISLFSGGHLRLLDIPSGAGAGAAMLLSIFAELRATNRLPRTDLQVHVVGGEKNPFQHSFAVEFFTFLSSWWLDNGIHVTWDFCEWDVLSNESTTQLLDSWKTTNVPQVQYALLGANFSGFLDTTIPGTSQRYVNEAVPSLSNVFSRAGLLNAPTFWIEPKSNSAERTFKNLQSLILNKIKRLTNQSAEPPSSLAQLADPIVAGHHFPVNSRGIHLRPVQQ